ncbi:MAG: rod shape-determining protein MreC [Bacteroidales bacterium]|nr:rod shape-determining protein MreC [Bacteroidales bacterium]
MRYLFAYILKHYFVFLFILLEVFSFSLVVQNNYQRATFLNSTYAFTGKIFAAYSNITDYFSLKKANEELLEENVGLRNRLESTLPLPDTNPFYSYDSTYRYIGAKVIKNTISRQKNYLMLDKGWKQGIQKDMGVTTARGIVGTVIGVSENYSMVMSILNIDNRINARIKKNNHLGNMEWDGKNYRFGLLTDIPVHLKLNNGDTIITSGNSQIFPEGIPFGKVDEYYEIKNEKFNTARIEYFEDYNQLYYVYVIINLNIEEQKELESSLP